MTPEQKAKKQLQLETYRRMLDSSKDSTDTVYVESLAKRIKDLELELIQGSFDVKKVRK